MDMTGEDEWSDWEEEDAPAQTLLENRVLPSAKEAIDFDKRVHHFDIYRIKTKLGLDFYGCVRLVNYVRGEVAASGESEDIRALGAAIEEVAVADGGRVFANERFLRPVLDGDALLMNLEGLLLETEASGDADEGTASVSEADEQMKILRNEECGKPPANSDSSTSPSLASHLGAKTVHADVDGRLRQLEKENAALREALETAEARLKRANIVLEGIAGEGDNDGQRPDAAEQGMAGMVDNDSYYFRSYAHWGVHETMLTDTVRTGGYEQAICDNATFFKEKVVLDVGCGTGVLSCFAARAGARKVIGVDRSDIVDKAREVVRDNGFDGVVTLLQGKVEDVELGVDHVDVIISEWMGYCLFYESMLPSVLFARNKYLAEGGVVLPDRTPLFIQGWRDPDGRLEFWKDVHGLDYSSMADMPLGEASVEVVRGTDVVTERCLCRDFNIETVEDEDLDFAAPFELVVTSPGIVSGLVLSFDTGFFAGPNAPPPPPPTVATGAADHVVEEPALSLVDNVKQHQYPRASWFSTGPQARPTHWKQTLLWLRPSEQPQELSKGDVISGQLDLHRNEVNPRELGLTVSWTATEGSSGRKYGGIQKYAVC